MNGKKDENCASCLLGNIKQSFVIMFLVSELEGVVDEPFSGRLRFSDSSTVSRHGFDAVIHRIVHRSFSPLDMDLLWHSFITCYVHTSLIISDKL